MKNFIITSVLLVLLMIGNNMKAQVQSRPNSADAIASAKPRKPSNTTASKPIGNVTNKPAKPRKPTLKEIEAKKQAALREEEANRQAIMREEARKQAEIDKAIADKIAADKALAENAKGINDYVRSLNYDPRKLLAVEADGGTLLREKPVESSTKRDDRGNAVVICTTSKYSMSNNFDEVVVMQPTNGIVYPGALIYADNNLVRGQPRPLTNLPLGQIELTVDLPGIGSNGTFVVKNPSNGAVQTNLDEALKYWNENSAYKEGYVNAARSSSNAAISYSSEQLALSLGVNVKWASGNAAAQFSYKSSSSKKVAVMMFKQVFYTVTSAPPANPANAFAPEVTASQAQSAFNNETPPAYIQSVSYGRIIMFRMESSDQATDAEMEASFRYATGAVEVSADAKAKYESILKNSTITYALLGGNGEVLSEIASAASFKDIEPLIKGKNSVYSKANPGVPISYTVRFLKDQSIAKMGTTTEYTKEVCQNIPNMSIQLIHSGAYVAKYEITYNNAGKEVKVETGNQTAGWKQTFYFPGDATNVRLGGWAMTGLVWAPWGEIYNKILTPEELKNKCITNTGTTLNRNFSVGDCR